MTFAVTFIALGLMAAATYATRVGGYLAVNRVAMTPRVHRVLEATTGAALVAIIAPAAADGDTASKLALATAAIVMIITRKPIAAVVAGAVAAVTLRALG